MAIGAVLFSFPVALFCAVWMFLLHGMNVAELVGVYAAFGGLTTFVGLAVLWMSASDQP